MSAQEQPRFTPGQILEAGRRAAGEGRTEVARQFYQHVVANFPGSAEAHAAAQAVEHLRLDHPPHLVDPGRFGPPDPTLASHVAAPGPAYVEPPSAIGPSGYNGWQHPANLAPPVAAPSDDHSSSIPLPEPVRDYRTGQVLARLTTWCGGAVVLLALALLPVAVLHPRMLSAIPLLRSLDYGFAGTLAMAITGLGLVMLGQLVRALLDHANAARDLAAIQRARATPPVHSAQGTRRRRG